jgi:uncharacterized protein
LFVGRQNELGLLGEELKTAKASLAIIYGRRRIGKSTLILEAIKDRTHVFYQATRVTSLSSAKIASRGNSGKRILVV